MDTGEAAENVDYVSKQVVSRVRVLMTEIAKTVTRDDQPVTNPLVPGRAAVNPLNMFVSTTQAPANPRRAQLNRIDDELAMWAEDRDCFLELPSGREETILEYWRRKSDEPGYKLLPLVARVLFSAPTSSAQIERDFGISGMMVTKTRNRLSAASIDMCAFLNANQGFVDITQVAKLSKTEVSGHKPRMSVADVHAQIDADIDAMMRTGFSSLNVSKDGMDSMYADSDN